MIEKRFILHDGLDVKDNVTGEIIPPCLDRGLSELIDLLNALNDENEQFKQQITSLKVELHTHKHPLWSTREAERKVSELSDLLCNETKKNAILLEEINLLRKENMRLKEVQKND